MKSTHQQVFEQRQACQLQEARKLQGILEELISRSKFVNKKECNLQGIRVPAEREPKVQKFNSEDSLRYHIREFTMEA